MKKTVAISINKHRLIYSAVFAVALMFLMLIIFDLFYFPIVNAEKYVSEKYGGSITVAGGKGLHITGSYIAGGISVLLIYTIGIFSIITRHFNKKKGKHKTSP